MVWTEVIGLALTAIAIVFSVIFYYDKKSSAKFKELEDNINKKFDSCEVRTNHLEEIQMKGKDEREKLDKRLTSIEKEVAMEREYNRRQLVILDETQKDNREFMNKQVEDIKHLIESLVIKMDTYFSEVQKLNIRVAEHIASK